MVVDPLLALRSLARLWFAGGGVLVFVGLGLLLADALPAALACLLTGALLLGAGGWQGRRLRQASDAVNGLVAELGLRERAAQHVGSPVLVTDSDLNVLWCNQVFERVTGYRLDELRGGRPGRWLRSPNADPAMQERIRDAVRNHTDLDIELLHRYRDGQDHWVRLQLAAQRDARGQPAGFVGVLINIDAQVRTREALRQALRHTGSLMRSLDEYVIVAETDAAGRFTRVNRRFQDISGYTEAELLGQGFAMIGSGWHSAAFWRDMWSCIGQGRPWQGEICNRSRQGSLYWVQTLVAPILGADGTIKKFVSIQSDISAHRLAQMELSKSETLLRRTSQLAGVGGWTAQLDSGQLQITPECRQLLGLQEREVTHVHEFWRCFGQGARLIIRAQLQELAQGQREEVNMLAPVRPLAGTPARWVRLVASVRESRVEGVGQMPGRIIGAVQDQTQQMAAQQRIRDEQRILHSAMDAVGDAFALYDPQSLLVYCNEAYAALLPPGHPPLQGVSHEVVLHGMAMGGTFRDAIGREADWVQEQLRAPGTARTDPVCQTADGRWFRFIDRVTADGHRVVLRSDVTELQRALLRADAAALSKGQFLANMSHEIRTPINAVMGLLQMLGRTALAPPQADMVGKSLTAARSLLDIVNDILDFSKLEAGKMELHAAPFRLADLRHELEVILAGARGHKPLALAFETDDALPEVLVGDGVRLRQVLINLGGNAVKFTEAGRVCLGWRLLSCTGDVVRVRFEVTDTGIGIAPEQQARIFDSFSQAEASTTRRFGGSGLGLTICQRLVGLMGGHIDLQSQPGQGSRFGFDIDLQVGHASDLPPAPETIAALAGSRLAGLRLLLAEDNPLNQEVALALLRDEGAAVTLAHDGQQAVQALQADPLGFDLVLMDMQMPVLDGLQATERIRQLPGLGELPVIAMTANATPQDRERCLRAGMNDHVGKPFDIEQLVALIRAFTRGDDFSRLPHATPAVAPQARADAGADQAPSPALRDDVLALRRLGGNVSLLGQLRARFPATAQTCLQQAQACGARRDRAGAADALHQLKGAAGVVGADRLALRCAGLEQRLRAPPADAPVDAHSSLFDDLAAEVAATLAALAPAVHAEAGSATAAPPETAGPSADDPAVLQTCLDDMAAWLPLLASADLAALDAHEDWLARHATARAAPFDHFNALIESMQLQAAAQAGAGLLGDARGALLEAQE
jgi:PAS domain S-box-containing protein